jgi:NifB/MoaA-like Fe-S oxidoreductase
MSFICCVIDLCPLAERYEGMPQYSNGVGMTRDFLDGLNQSAAPLASGFAATTRHGHRVWHVDCSYDATLD